MANILVGDLPTWLSFDPATRQMSGTPDAADSFAVTIGAEYPSGNLTERTFTFEAKGTVVFAALVAGEVTPAMG